jgi:hypothetical protein
MPNTVFVHYALWRCDIDPEINRVRCVHIRCGHIHVGIDGRRQRLGIDDTAVRVSNFDWDAGQEGLARVNFVTLEAGFAGKLLFFWVAYISVVLRLTRERREDEKSGDEISSDCSSHSQFGSHNRKKFDSRNPREKISSNSNAASAYPFVNSPKNSAVRRWIMRYKNRFSRSFLSIMALGLWACSSGSSGPTAGKGGNTGDDGSGGSAGDSSAGGGAGQDNEGGAPANTGGTKAGGGGTGGSSANSGGSSANTGGTAANTGGMVGTGGTGANTGGTPAVPAPLFSHDFEGDTEGGVPGGMWSGNGEGKVKVSTEKANSGKKSIKIVSASGDATIRLASDKILKGTRKTAYLRFMVWMENFPGKGTDVPHWDLAAHHGLIKGGGFNINGFYSVGGFDDSTYKMQLFGDDTNNKGRSDCTKSAPLTLPLKQWNCIEFKIDENEILQYGWTVNGKALQQFSFLYDTASAACVPNWNITNGVWYLPEIQYTKIGFRHWNTQTKPVTLWIDDVALSDKPIGCPTP